MLFYKLQETGNFFVQMKLVEQLHMLLSTRNETAPILDQIRFSFAVHEAVELKKLFLDIDGGVRYFEVTLK